MWRCGQQHHSCVSAGSQCQSKCFELRLVTLCHSPHPLLSPDIQVPGLSVVCPNGIFYMYQLNWHVACMFQCVQVYVDIIARVALHSFIVSRVVFFSFSFYILLPSFVMWTILLFYIGVFCLYLGNELHYSFMITDDNNEPFSPNVMSYAHGLKNSIQHGLDGIK